jgi:hypothetical protein
MFVCSLLFLVSPVGGHVITQEVGHGFPTAKFQVKFKLNLCEICFKQSSTGAGVCPSSYGSRLLIIFQPQLCLFLLPGMCNSPDQQGHCHTYCI